MIDTASMTTEELARDADILFNEIDEHFQGVWNTPEHPMYAQQFLLGAYVEELRKRFRSTPLSIPQEAWEKATKDTVQG